ncbi:MAG TPA: GNAT family N-acetyltransferase [Solirubrobacterales bacterium]|nr:GNAT family N-acetyltransferase [Solirubrobacterales bacterium]HMU25979.1 GNAT family N-acetyltransferase [Solirubrobacterales bacterium]HMW46074.1 GNAT family N-acetyltransferase [Solirubrobacterales bacterium]HMX70778.1 GNAT family N-acetyltransferase [Solirubrobacterales bacterium]HMY24934.1 GNAT family N-acetyltransferase [Solirubrobacterales bacterium]
MGPETPLRIAGPADIGPVTRLIAGFRDFLADDSPTNAEIEATVGVLLRDRSTEFLLVGDPEAGFVQTRFRLSVWTGNEDAWLEDLFVDESARGKGYGRTLVEAAVERARSRGCDRIQLDVNQANEPAVKLYESCGFRPVHNPEKWGSSPDFFYTREIQRQQVG